MSKPALTNLEITSFNTRPSVEDARKGTRIETRFTIVGDNELGIRGCGKLYSDWNKCQQDFDLMIANGALARFYTEQSGVEGYFYQLPIEVLPEMHDRRNDLYPFVLKGYLEEKHKTL